MKGAASATAALSMVLAVLAAVALSGAYVNHDAAWYLYMSGRWLDGATLYRDVVDTNPPLIVWLSTPPVAVARALGTPAPALFKVWVFMVALAALAVCWRSIRRQSQSLAFATTAGLVFLCLLYPKGDFGQREHVAVLLALPYVVTTADRAASRSRAAAVAIGIAGGLGFAIKPHFVLAWVAVEAAALFWFRLGFRRPQLIAAAVTIVTYAALVLTLTPAYLHVLQQVREVYGGLDSEASLLRVPAVQVWTASAMAVAAIRWRSGDRTPILLFAAATGFLAAALLQFKGWTYQMYPARVFLAAFAISGVATLLEIAPHIAASVRGGMRTLGLAFSAGLVIWTARDVVQVRHPDAADLVSPLIAQIEHEAPAGPLAVLSMRTLIYPAFPAVNYTGAAWSLRQNSMWFLPGLYAEQDSHGPPFRPHAPDAMSATEREFFLQVENDLCSKPPALLLVEDPLALPPRGRRGIDFLAYYGQSERLARLFAHYAPDGRVGPLTSLRATGEPTCDR